MDISPIQSQNQGGSGGNKSATPGLGGLFAQMLLGIAPAEPATPDSGTEPQVTQPTEQGQPDPDGAPQDPTAKAGKTPGDDPVEPAQEATVDPAATGQPVAATPDQPQPAVVPTVPVKPGLANGQTGTVDDANGTATTPPANSAATAPTNSGTPTPDPTVPGSQLAAATPSDQTNGKKPQGQVAAPSGQPAATPSPSPDGTAETPGIQPPTEAKSAKALDGTQAQTNSAETGRPAPAEVVRTAQAPAAPAAPTDPVTTQAAAQPLANATRQAQGNDPLAGPNDDGSAEIPFGERRDTPSDRASGKPGDPVAPVLTGAAKPNTQQSVGQNGQQPGQPQSDPQAAARSGPPAQSEFLENLTTANQLARSFDLGFLSQINVSSDAPVQSFTLAADGASLVPTQQVSATGTIELSSALPGRGVVVDPGAQLAVQISRAINTQTNRFSIRLDPPELGRIDVKLDFARDGAVRATVSAERPDTLDLLQKDVQSLERALKDAGTDPNKLSLNFSLQDQQGDGQMAERGQNDSADARDGTGEDDDGQADADGQDRYRPRADALVDLHV